MSNIVIIGGGASGLVAAIAASDKIHNIIILEHKDKIGRKLLATGNGKCNYTNLIQHPECYRGNDNSFALKVLSLFGVDETISFFKRLGIYPKEKNGYVYPNSGQAVSVLEVLQMELEKNKVEICCDVHAEHISKKGNQFIISSNKGIYKADKIILSAGGCASPNLGSDGSGYMLAKELGHRIITPLPALVQLKSSEKYFKTLAGVRTEASIQLYVMDELISEEKGELLFANYGLSGIPVFQLSRFASKALNEKKKVYLKIDFLPELDWKETFALVMERIKLSPNKNMEQLLIGLLNNKLGYVSLKEAGIMPDLLCKSAVRKQIVDLVNQIKEWKVVVTEPNTFDQAQVTAGGIDTLEINPETMESKMVKGLYFTGEIIDIDGTCGGYNLQWAWSTGVVAGRSV